MISPNALTAWRTTHPGGDDEQVEQDLIMTRVAIEIANDPYLGNVLAWRGGTCLHKLFLPTARRYSEDLDYVAYGLSVENNDMRRLRAALRNVAERIGLEIGKPHTSWLASAQRTVKRSPPLATSVLPADTPGDRLTTQQR